MSKEKEEKFVIIKEYVNHNGQVLPTIMLDSLGEVMEYDDFDSAEKMRKVFELNSDSGHKYTLKPI